MATDLVCNADADENSARFFSDYDRKMYYFCSAECKRRFDDHPDQFIQQRAREELGLSS